METLKIENLTFTYSERKNPALSDITLSVSQGDFLVVCGYSGSGKSTLLRLLKPELSPKGDLSGKIFFSGKSLSALTQRESAENIAFVTQSAENQSVSGEVFGELAFTLENLGFDSFHIRRRVAEITAFFGFEGILHKSISELSGGQKQLVNLASAIILQPELLILDEPTAQLDPVSASEFLSAVCKINLETGTTVIMSEHRLDNVFPYAAHISVMENGKIICSGEPENVCISLKENKDRIFAAMPQQVRVWASVNSDFPCPMNINDGKAFLKEYLKTHTVKEITEKEKTESNKIAAEAHEVSFRYEKNSPDILKDFEFTAKKGEFFCICGSNGSGKTTALKVLTGIKKAQSGEIKLYGKAAYLPQEAKSVLTKSTVRECLEERAARYINGKEERQRIVTDISSLCRINHILDCHPYDISGGEQQKAALAKTLISSPDILFLDEPTRGLDAVYKKTLGSIIEKLKGRGISIVAVSHDIEFCAEYADRCGLLFDGELINASEPENFFSGSSFYTTAAERMTIGTEIKAVTAEKIIEVIGGECEKISDEEEFDFSFAGENKAKENDVKISLKKKKEKPSAKTVLSFAFLLLIIPVTLFLGVRLLPVKQYYITSVAVLTECMFPFFLSFESKKPTAGKIVTVAVLCASAVAGRAAFFFLPQFKPVAAVVIVSGFVFGSETGFLVGTLTMLTSNMLFSQGPWTPWQMFAMGMLGFFAGLLSKVTFGKHRKAAITLFGFLGTLIIYGGIVNPSTALITGNGDINFKIIMSYYLAGLPMDFVHALSTAFFLFFIGEAFIKILERVKLKYDIE